MECGVLLLCWIFVSNFAADSAEIRHFSGHFTGKKRKNPPLNQFTKQRLFYSQLIYNKELIYY